MGVASDLLGPSLFVYHSLPSRPGLMTQPDSLVGNVDVRFGPCPFGKGIIRMMMIAGDILRTRCAAQGFPHTDD